MLPPGRCRECKEVHASARCWVQKVGCVLTALGRGILWWPLSRGLAAGWGDLALCSLDGSCLSQGPSVLTWKPLPAPC